jgi:hypothetical protein
MFAPGACAFTLGGRIGGGCERTKTLLTVVFFSVRPASGTQSGVPRPIRETAHEGSVPEAHRTWGKGRQCALLY